MVSDSLIKKIVISVTVLIFAWYFCVYGRERNIFYGDASGYYMYLPATFIYHNLYDIANLPADRHIDPYNLLEAANMKATAKLTPKGYVLNQYTYGVAAMEAPFFLIAHGYEKITGGYANGYSDNYKNAVRACTMFYVLLGLLLVYKMVKRYFNPVAACITACCILIGTNLFWFTFSQQGMSHGYLFFLYALLIWLTIKVHEKGRGIIFAGVGLTVGIITLMRPTDIVCLLIPLLYNVYDVKTLKEKIRFITQHYKGIIIAIVSFILPIIPQLLYWKALTGSYVYYSYGAQSFNFLHPKIVSGLFYSSNGWLAYTPLMGFALAGILLFKKYKDWALCVWLLCPVYIYIIYSWYCFSYINGLGSRPMIHLYPLLAMPFAAFIVFVFRKGFAGKFVMSAIVLFFIAVNICNSMQQSTGVMQSEESNLTYNMQMLFRLQLHYDDLVVYDLAERQPDTAEISKIATLACSTYTDSTSAHSTKIKPDDNRYVYAMGANEYMDTVQIKYDAQKYKNIKWLKCSARLMYPNAPAGYYRHVIIISIDHNGQHILWKGCRIENKIAALSGHSPLILNMQAPGVWETIYFYIKIPKRIQDGDVIACTPWNPGKEQLYVENICVEGYK